MPIQTIDNVLKLVLTAGQIAVEEQQHFLFTDRDYKSDGSVLTSVDKKIEQFLCENILRLYPDVNIISEESSRPFDAEKSCTFVIDPIDGTDIFSQGLPGWCIAAGLLDHDFIPAAGIVYAPRWGSLYFADVGRPPVHNGRPLSRTMTLEPDSPNANLMVTSRIFRFMDLRSFKGKIRNIGAGALQMCFPLTSPAVIGAILGKTHIWDIAAAAAILNAAGLKVEYMSGDELLYEEILDGRPAMDLILCGSQRTIDYLRRIF